MKFSRVLAFAGFAGMAMSSAFAVLNTQAVYLDGNTSFDGWDVGAFVRFNGVPYPGTAAWPNGIGSNVAGSEDATLEKAGNGVNGGPYPIGTSIYHGGSSTTPNTLGGSLYVQDLTALSNVKTVAFQLIITDAYSYDFYDDIAPKLVVNGNSYSSNFFHELDSESVGDFGGEPAFAHLYAFQWDVSGLGAISSFEVAWSSVQHSRILGLQLDQSDAIHGDYFAAVPEPGTIVALSAGALALLRRRKKKTA